MKNSIAYEIAINKSITNLELREALISHLKKIRNHSDAEQEFAFFLIDRIGALYMEREDWKHHYEKLIEDWSNLEEKGKRHGKSH